MALIKQPIDISFAQGLDLKTDPNRVAPGKFLSLANSVFDKQGRLTKRFGYGLLPTLPDDTSKFVTTFNGNLTAIGMDLQALSVGSAAWINKGTLQPLSLTTLPLIRSNTNQSQADSVVAPNGLMLTVYTDNVPVMGVNVAVYKYVVADSVTGQNIVEPTVLATNASTLGTPRVFLLGHNFIIIYTTKVGSNSNLVYIAVSSYTPTVVSAPVIIATTYTPSQGLNFDAITVNSNLYIAYNTQSGGQSIKVTYLQPTLGAPVAAKTYLGEIATLMSLSSDVTNPSSPIIHVTYFDSGSTNLKTLAVDKNANPILAPTLVLTGTALANVTTTAQNGLLSVFEEVVNAYSYDPSIPTNYIQTQTVTNSGTVTAAVIIKRSVGLASKAFLYKGESYFLVIYYSVYQPSYFFLNSAGKILAKLAYSNAGQYYTFGLPNVSLNHDFIQTPYLFKDLVQAINKAQGLPNPAGVYAQTGINLVTFDMDRQSIVTAEIGTNLNISGGFITAYDGYLPVEQEFFVWPDNVELTTSATGGLLTAQTYFYQVTYEWADNQGNLFRSAPSIPVSIVTTGSTSSNTVYIPTLRLTYKTANPVKLVIYRWSTAQQVYYQVTSILVPLLNDTSVDFLTFLDTQSDSQIIGNNIIYTTGGVIENISPPGADILALFNNRLWLIDAEDRNLLWFSKQVIEATPVEMSDLLTLYVAPTTSAQGSTGPMTSLSPMDDKLIIFKANALGYISGQGPDNTGANNQYSDFILINSVVGCDNQQSIVFQPQGLMFQSNKGIWLLGRDLSTQYIGASVETLTTGARVLSAVNVPASNQVLFTLDTGITLMYDYYFGQWGTFVGIPAVSSTIYAGLHTFIDHIGQVFQQSIGAYLDNTSPVLMSFTTGWMSLAGLQGYERFYSAYLLGEYLSPFKLNVQFAYDYNPALSQSVIVTPQAYSPPWGGEALWGSGEVWGGISQVFEERVFPDKQKCESFSLTVNEIYDQTYATIPGAGLTLSGMNLIVGAKRAFRTQSVGKSS